MPEKRQISATAPGLDLTTTFATDQAMVLAVTTARPEAAGPRPNVTRAIVPTGTILAVDVDFKHRALGKQHVDTPVDRLRHSPVVVGSSLAGWPQSSRIACQRWDRTLTLEEN